MELSFWNEHLCAVVAPGPDEALIHSPPPSLGLFYPVHNLHLLQRTVVVLSYLVDIRMTWKIQTKLKKIITEIVECRCRGQNLILIYNTYQMPQRIAEKLSWLFATVRRLDLILYGLRHVIMLFNLILQPKDWSATSLHQIRSPATTTAGTGQKLLLAAVPVQLFQLASSPCFHWTEMWQTVNPTRRWRILLGRQINGRNSGRIFPQMQGNWFSRSSQPGIRTSPILSNPVSIAILFASR